MTTQRADSDRIQSQPAVDYHDACLQAYPPAFQSEVHWYEDNLKVETPQGQIVPFRLRPVQIKVLWEIWHKVEAKEPVFIDVLKARREGISTLVSAVFFRYSVQHNNRRNAQISCDQESTDNIYDMVRQFHLSHMIPCPCDGNEDCQSCNGTGEKNLALDKDSAGGMRFVETKSRFNLFTAGSKARTGRSFAAHHLHFSEFDFVESEKVYGSVMQIVPNTYPTIVIIESTAQGPDGPMQRHWIAAENGENGFTPLFFAWFDFEDYVRDLSWDDLLKRSPEPWRSQNKTFCQAAIRRYERALGRRLGERRTDQGAAEDRGGNGTQELRVQGVSESPASPEVSPVEEAERGVRARRYPPGDPRNGGSDPYSGDERLDRWGFPTGAVPGGVRPDGPTARKLKQQYRRDKKRLGLTGKSWKPEVFEALLRRKFDESMDEYEQGLCAEFDLTMEQINFLRWVKYAKCDGDEITRRREYPSRPDEAFEAAGESVLDPLVLGRWAKDARENPPTLYNFGGHSDKYGDLTVVPNKDVLGYSMVWEEPQEGVEYAMGVDPSTGSKTGDWTVACMVRADTGDQVAEFRARIDPDLAIDQIEALGVWYNKAFTVVEANSYGLVFARALEDRGTLQMFEREIPDSRTPNKTVQLIGWVTTPKTRNNLMTEVRKAVREDRCKIRSEETIREGRTLYVNRTPSGIERIEARPNCHDDGIFGYALALIGRNRINPPLIDGEAPPITEKDIHPFVEELLTMHRKEKLQPRVPWKKKHQSRLLVKYIDPDRRNAL